MELIVEKFGMKLIIVALLLLIYRFEGSVNYKKRDGPQLSSHPTLPLTLIRISGVGLLSVTDLLSELARSRYPDYHGCREMSNSCTRLSAGSRHTFKLTFLRMED